MIDRSFKLQHIVCKMDCFYCGENTKVTDKRRSIEGVRRRRECLKCKKRFTTYEKVTKNDLYVIKKDGRREKFDRAKLEAGIEKSFEKRPVPKDKINQMINEIQNQLTKTGKREEKSSTIGKISMKKIKKLDPVAYIRFASVYMNFQDIKDFKTALTETINNKK